MAPHRHRMGPGAFKRQRGPVSTFRNDLVSADIDSTGARAYPRAPLLEQCQIVGSPAQAVPGFRGAVTSTRSKSTKLPRWSHRASKSDGHAVFGWSFRPVSRACLFRENVFRLGAFRECREPTQIAEDDGDLASVTGEQALVLVGKNNLSQLG